MVFRTPGWCSEWVVLQTHLCPGVPDGTPFLLGGGCLLLLVSCLLADIAGIPQLGQREELCCFRVLSGQEKSKWAALSQVPETQTLVPKEGLWFLEGRLGLCPR